MEKPKLEWEEKFSVKVKEIDDQHKKMFDTINHLIDVLGSNPTTQQIDEIIKSLVEYKKFHFATEEKYFDEFQYEGTEEHKNAHKMFNEKLTDIVQQNHGKSMELGFKLIDFLEDWLVDHLMVEDQKYVACFQAHGLK